jgi:hypothetical protein
LYVKAVRKELRPVTTLAKLATAYHDVARVGDMDGGAIAGSSGSDEHVVYLDIPRVIDLDPRVLCDRRDRQVCDGDALRVVEQQALDTHSRSPDDSQSMSGARANHQFTFIVVAEELDRSALVPEGGHRRGELPGVPNLNRRNASMGGSEWHN